MDRKTISAIGLIFLVIMAYQLVIMPRFAPPPPPPPPPPGTRTPVAQQAPPPAVPAPEAAALAPQAMEPVPDLPENIERISINIDNELFRAELDTLRGSLRSWRLKEYAYPEKQEPLGGEPLELVGPSTGVGALGIAFTDPLSQGSFSSPLVSAEKGNEITLFGADSYGLLVRRVYTFSEDRYGADLTISFENRSETPRNLSWEIFLGPDLDPHRTDSRVDRPLPISYAAGKLDKLKVENPGQRQDVGPVSWVAIGDRYFLTALSLSEGSLSGFVRKTADAKYQVGYRTEALTLAPGQVVTYRLLSYLGPMERDRLSSYGIGLENSVQYGWFSWLALPFLTILKFFFGFLKNWGLAILALTLLVKLALFPISQHMYRSMRKMQALQPQVQSLKTKFKDDSKALQQATMGLYKEYKVNPMAGCLPMVVQIPVFFALYRVLYNAIELRGASFLYIPDLSQKDPYYIAPLLMGATMILQQKLSPSSADPKQARMMMFMPIIFTAMFLNFSSGLVLYFLFSNVLAIGEQYLVRRWAARNSGQAGTAVTTSSSGKGRKSK